MSERLTEARALGAAAGAYAQGFARVAAVTFPLVIADPAANAERLLEQARVCDVKSVAVAVFTELCLTGYAHDDLVLQDAVLDGVDSALARIAEASVDLMPVLVIGAPLRHGNRLFNCAVVIHRGRVLGVAPKSYLPTYREFYERRWYASGDDQRGGEITVAGQSAPFGPELLFEASDVPGLVLHAEICEDMWIPVPPSAEAALAGATVLLNLSGSPITVGRADDRQLLARSASSRCLAAYVYAAAGMGESSNDLSWDGETLIYETGRLLAATDRFPDGPRIALADIDVELLRQERLRQGTFDDNRRALDERIAEFRRVPFELNPPTGDIGFERAVDRYPFVPDDPARLAQDCYEAYNIQVSGLEQRMSAIGGPKLVIGVSGGLDSTHALLVCAQALDRLGRPRSDIIAVTMPGFATSDQTKSNAYALAEALGVTFEELDIKPTAEEMFRRIGHPYANGEPVYDVTFENVQAGLRTDYLFRIANQRGGIVVGTGDLSEFALGWATYGVGDQMSHYAVNSGVPKTLMQHLIRWVSSSGLFEANVSQVLERVLATEISPELVPAGEDGVAQSTEKTIGPYALHDFALFHVLRYGLRPSKIAWLAAKTWADASTGTWPAGFPDDAKVEYSADEVVAWLEVFLKRFFGFAQFKRTAVPNGPKVAAGGSLSPRGDWRAPSDSTATTWLAELHSAFPKG
ncbi:NAD(+) synthase [Gryllotalpicola daejeonensis]|uniref:Glutamine-dependent NAD(+) synthetase n=1 Tax=Gryllotalpicola daejeonensis TaxID=993087 RepID=A0ABP7ZFW1_9MICO